MSMTIAPGCVLAVQPLDARAAFDGRVVQAERAMTPSPVGCSRNPAPTGLSSALRSNISIAWPARARKIAAAWPAVP